MLKIEFDAANKELATCLGNALLTYAGETGAHPQRELELPEQPAEPEPEPAELPSGAAVDEHGVLFDPEFCGEATEPFYGSGKKKGQWKKRRGVDEGDYVSWYNAQLLEQPLAREEDEPEVARADTAAAFGSGAAESAREADAPDDLGTFMLWVSERQAAGRIGQDDINAAYAQAGIEPSAIFQGEPDVVAGYIRDLVAILGAK